jgi:hypothetical protein
VIPWDGHRIADVASRNNHPNYSAHYAAITQRQFARFDGKTWVLFGDVIGADSGGKD